MKTTVYLVICDYENSGITHQLFDTREEFDRWRIEHLRENVPSEADTHIQCLLFTKAGTQNLLDRRAECLTLVAEAEAGNPDALDRAWGLYEDTFEVEPGAFLSLMAEGDTFIFDQHEIEVPLPTPAEYDRLHHEELARQHPESHSLDRIEAIRELARERYEDEGALEIDEQARVSMPDGDDYEGAYVQAWVWVPRDDIEVVCTPEPERVTPH